MLMTKEVEVDRMCDLSQIFIDKGMGNGLLLGESKGKEESNVACVRSLSKHLSIRYEEAMDLLEIEEALRPSILRLLTEEAWTDTDSSLSVFYVCLCEIGSGVWTGNRSGISMKGMRNDANEKITHFM